MALPHAALEWQWRERLDRFGQTLAELPQGDVK